MDRTVRGLREYVEGKRLNLERLEIEGWRPVRGEDARCWIATTPDLSWMSAAADSPTSAEAFNIGWYRKEDDGYTRHDGHWVIVVGGSGGGLDFTIHNPDLPTSEQVSVTSVTLARLSDFTVVRSGRADGSKAGFYQISGPALPYPRRVDAAVVDSVVVFSVSR